jgi:hypothetical protein
LGVLRETVGGARLLHGLLGELLGGRMFAARVILGSKAVRPRRLLVCLGGERVAEVYATRHPEEFIVNVVHLCCPFSGCLVLGADFTQA